MTMIIIKAKRPDNATRKKWVGGRAVKAKGPDNKKYIVPLEDG